MQLKRFGAWTPVAERRMRGEGERAASLGLMAAIDDHMRMRMVA